MKKRTWIILIGLLVVAIAATAVALLLPDSVDDEEVKVGLYWNIEQVQYEDPFTGQTRRTADSEGDYHLLMSVEGQQVKLTCKDTELVDKIDSQMLVGLEVNQDGRILQVYTLGELGYGKAAWGFYVQSIAQDGTITALSSKSMRGEQAQITLSDAVECYYVATADMLAGMQTDVRELDRILGVTNAKGELSHIFVIGRTYTGTGETKYCQHCKQDVKWWSWDYENALPEINGHFYLTSDVQLTKQSLVRANQQIIIDLAGHTVTGKNNYRLIATWGEGAYLGIMDTSSAQTGKLIAKGTQMDQGTCLWIRYGTVELFSGILDASEAYTVKNGAGVLIKSGATFNMYGGEICGGTSLAITTQSGKVTNGCGGNLYIEGTFNMYDGKITDGRSVGIITGNASSMGIGGNLYVTKTGVVNITGGVIQDGESTGPGANIYTNGQINVKGDVQILGGTVDGPGKNGGSIYITALGTLNMEGGQISNGMTQSGSGGNICSQGTVHIVGANITGGAAEKYANSIYAIGGSLHIEDSSVTDCLRVGKQVDFSLAGTVDIDKLELPAEALVNVDALKADSSVVVTASGFFTKKTENNCASCFQADGYTGKTIYSDGRLTIGYYSCACGNDRHASWCDGKARLWKAWAENGSLPNKDDYFYLIGNVELTNQCVIKENQKVTLDLRGYTIYGKKDLRIFATWGEGAYLGIVDSSKAKTGQLVARGEKMDQGGCLWIRFGTVELFGGTLDASKARTVKNGAAVLLKEGATFNMYGGQILGGTSLAVTGKSGNVSNGCGGNIYIEGNFNMFGGKIAKGRSVGVITGDTSSMGIGGNLYVSKTGVVNITGGIIEAGNSTGPGANIYTNGQINIKGDVQILGGTADGPGKNGGSIYVTQMGALNMQGGTISGGTAVNGSGGNLCTYGTVNIVGATIGKGAANKHADAIYAVGGTLHIKNATVTHSMRVGKEVDFSLAGTVDIGKLELPAESLVNVDGLKTDSKVVITASGFFTEKTENDCAACFLPDGYAGEAIYADNRLTVGYYRCICGSQTHADWCNGEALLWKAWTENATLPVSDECFYLTKDVKLTNQCVIRENQRVTLDLCGYTVYGRNELRIFATWGEGAYLGIVDSSQAQTGTLVARGEKMDQGGCLWIRFGTVELFGGTLDASGATTVKNGAAVLLKDVATFNMYGGTIKGGTSQAIKDNTGKPINGSGGNLYVEGTFNMYGGTICDGKAVGLYEGNGCLMGLGGNLYVTKTGTAQLMGGTLKDGRSSSGGGNIYMAGLVHVGEGMQILGGTADGPVKSGGNININASGKLYIDGGLVSGGTATNLGGVICCNGQVFISAGNVSGGTAGSATSHTIVVLKNASLTLSGGTVDGAIRQAAGAEVILKENPVVTGTGISSADGVFLTIEGQLGEHAQVAIPMDKLNCYFAKTSIPGNTAGFVAAEGYEILFDAAKNQLFYKATVFASNHAHEGDAEDVRWIEWDGSAFMDGGHYYLPEGGLELEGRATVNGIRVTLCLNGQTLTGKTANRTFFILNGGELTICDCSAHETGKVVAQGVNKENGGNIMIGSKSTLNLQGGTIMGGSVKEGMFGGNVNIVGNAAGNGVLNMTGGRITGGNADENAGGNVYITGTLNMSGGQIDGLVVAANTGLSKIHISGSAKITGNATNLYLPAGKLINVEGILENAKIGITLANGTGVFTRNTDAQNVSAFEPDNKNYKIRYNGTAIELSSGDAEDETPKHTHEDDSQSVCWTEWDGAAFVDGGHYYLPEGGLELEGRATVNGIRVTLCLNGQTLTGKTANRTFFILNGGELTICDCSAHETGKVVAQGVNKENGGNIMIGSKSTLNLQGGTIMGGSVKEGMFGGNINIVGNAAGNGVLNMTGGRITGGNADENAGGNVYISGTLNMSGGQIDGQVVAANTGLSKINISGSAKITGNATNLYLPAGKLVNVEGVLDQTATIGITLAKGTGVFTQPTDAQNVSRFQPDDGQYVVNHNGTELELAIKAQEPELPENPEPEPTGHDHCYCNGQLEHEHVYAGWTCWDGDPQTLLSGGYYVIENDIALGDTIVLGSDGQTPQTPVNIYLCLNGKTITAAKSKQLFQIYSGYTLNICDCSQEKTGQIRGNDKFTGTGGVISIFADGVLNQYGGIITGGFSSGNGGNIAVTANASYTLYNGKVTAGKSGNLGGNISVSAGAVFTMLGGEISGGTAKTSGKNSNNIIMAAAGTMDLQGGYIQGNVRATNGTVKLSGTIRIADGDGTNLSVNKNSIIKIEGQLSGTKQVGVSGSVVVATDVAEDVSAYFFADTAGKTVVYDPDKKELKIQ